MRKLNVKSIAALGVGTMMVGATIFGASAALLSDYPAPFVVDGTPASNLAIVVGDAADGSDVVGAVDIIQSLQTSAVVRTALATRGGGGVVVEGDAVEIGSTSDLLEINETIGDVRETLTEVDLDMLKGGQIVTDEGSTEYNQYLRFNESIAGVFPPSGAVVFDEDERDRVGHYLFWNDGATLFEWELEFEEGLESETEGDDLEDLEDEDIIMLGQPFVIVDTDLKNSSGNPDLTVELMGGAISAILGENDKETYVVDGKEYEVEVLVISETAKGGEGSVKFRINGEITDELEDGETDVLADGTQIGIRDILATGKDIQKSIVQFYLGAYKVEFQDTNTIGSGAEKSGTEVNEETIEDSEVVITGSFISGGFSGNDPIDGSEYEINNIKYRLFADAVLGDVFIPPGSGLREQLDEPEGMLTPFWDIRYEGLMDTGVTIVRTDAAGDDEYDLEFTNQEGIFYDMPLASNEIGTFKWGDDDDDLWFVESTDYCIGDDDFFVVSNCDPESGDNTCFTHVLRFDSHDPANNQLTFTDLGTGTREITLQNSQANLIVGGITYKVENLTNSSGTFLRIDLDGDGTITNGSKAFIAIQGEGIIEILNATNQTQCISTIVNSTGSQADRFTINLTTLAKEFDEADVDERILWDIESRTGNEIGIVQGSIRGHNGTFFGPLDLEENEDLEQALSGYGVFLELFDPTTSDEAEDLTIEYPLSQRGARVFVTGGLVTTTTVEGDVTERVQPIQIGAAKLASEIADITQFNAIVVGGPCANPIAAQLMGNPEPCWEAVPENKAVVKLFEHANGNVAMLVAGRAAKNTRQASRAVATNQISAVNSKEAEVSGTTLADITVKAV